jgi:predicted nucleic acid-binding protein
MANQNVPVEERPQRHEMAWRKEISAQRSEVMLDRLLKAPVQIQTPDGLTEAAWRVADDLGWARTYDAHYVAFAQMLACKLASIDERLLRGVVRLNIAVRPCDL